MSKSDLSMAATRVKQVLATFSPPIAVKADADKPSTFKIVPLGLVRFLSKALDDILWSCHINYLWPMRACDGVIFVDASKTSLRLNLLLLWAPNLLNKNILSSNSSRTINQMKIKTVKTLLASIYGSSLTSDLQYSVTIIPPSGSARNGANLLNCP